VPQPQESDFAAVPVLVPGWAQAQLAACRHSLRRRSNGPSPRLTTSRINVSFTGAHIQLNHFGAENFFSKMSNAVHDAIMTGVHRSFLMHGRERALLPWQNKTFPPGAARRCQRHNRIHPRAEISPVFSSTSSAAANRAACARRWGIFLWQPTDPSTWLKNIGAGS